MGFLSAHTIPSLNHVIASPSSLHYHLQCGNNLFRWQLQFQFQYLQSSPLSTKYLTVLPSRLTCPLSLIQAFMKPHPSPLPLILHFQLYTKVKSSFYQNPAFRPIYDLIIYRCFKKHHLMSKVLTFSGGEKHLYMRFTIPMATPPQFLKSWNPPSYIYVDAAARMLCSSTILQALVLFPAGERSTQLVASHMHD